MYCGQNRRNIRRGYLPRRFLLGCNTSLFFRHRQIAERRSCGENCFECGSCSSSQSHSNRMANTTGRKFGGREKGTPNKLTKELRGVLKNLLHYELENLPHQLEKLQPKERVELIIKLLPYGMPRVEQTSYRVGELNPDNMWD